MSFALLQAYSLACTGTAALEYCSVPPRAQYGCPDPQPDQRGGQELLS